MSQVSSYSLQNIIALAGQPTNPPNPPFNTAYLFYNATTDTIIAIDSTGKSILASGGSSGPSAGTVVTKTTNYTTASADTGSTLIFNLSANATLTLPSTAPASGWQINVVVIGTSGGVLTVSPNGLTLNGFAINQPVNSGQGFSVFTDGSNYFLGNLDTLASAPYTINVHDYGAAGNTMRVTDGITNTSGNTVSSASYSFTQADVGKAIYAVHNNTPAFSASSTIASVTGGVATIAGTVAHSNASGCVVVWGHNDTTAAQAAAAAANALGAAVGQGASVQLFFPAGGYWLTSATLPAINLASTNADLAGAGMAETILYFPPDFPYSGTGTANLISITAAATNPNNQGSLHDLTVDGSTATINTSNMFFVSIAAPCRNFQMVNFQNSGNGSQLQTSGSLLHNVIINGTGNCLTTGAAGTDLFITDCQFTSSNLTCFTAAQGPYVHAVNSNFIGSTTAITPSNSVAFWGTFTNCRISATTTGVSGITGNTFYFTDCRITAATPISIVAGQTVSAGGSQIVSTSTNAVNNAGTFVDLGGNTYTGLLAGAGVYLGCPYTVAKDRISGEQAAIPSGSPPSSNILYSVPANGQGYYRISYSTTITGAAGSNSVLGGVNGFQVVYNNGNGDNIQKTSPAGPTSSANATGTMLSGSVIIYAEASTNITYTFGYTTNGVPRMTYDLAITTEYLGI